MGALIFGAVLMFELFNFITKDYERKLKHSEYLVKEAFEHHASNGDVYYEDDKISSISISWVKSVYANQHLKHKKYKELCHAYEYARDYANRRIPEIEKKIQQYRETVVQKLKEAQIQIQVSERFIDNKTEHYNVSFVRHLIFDDLQRLHKGREANKLRIDDSTLSWDGTTFAVSEVSSLEYLRNAIQSIENDETIIDIIRYIEAERLRLDNNFWLKRFNDNREEIVKQVKDGGRPLEGKCKAFNCSF